MSQIEPCPVCGNTPHIQGGVNYWICDGDVLSHIITGPSNDKDGELWNAMVRGMRANKDITIPLIKELEAHLATERIFESKYNELLVRVQRFARAYHEIEQLECFAEKRASEMDLAGYCKHA